MLKKVQNLFAGNKTYIGIALGVIYSVLIALGVVESNEIIWTALIAWTGVAFRLAIK